MLLGIFFSTSFLSFLSGLFFFWKAQGHFPCSWQSWLLVLACHTSHMQPAAPLCLSILFPVALCYCIECHFLVGLLQTLNLHFHSCCLPLLNSLPPLSAAGHPCWGPPEGLCFYIRGKVDINNNLLPSSVKGFQALLQTHPPMWVIPEAVRSRGLPSPVEGHQEQRAGRGASAEGLFL